MPKEKLFETLQEHHLWQGETVSFPCPHCGKNVDVEAKTMEGDTDMIEVYWGKNLKEIERKKEEADNAR